ncbi:MAG: tRNA (adenosine(37)-N6)-threonylcarbamoyltransferase complex transferase subunit TsaD, partial [Parcubacteria group bacterium SW_4_46_8]
MIARAFEEAVADVLKAKTKKALGEYTPHSLILGGGVVANQYLRNQFTSLVRNRHDTELILP